MEFDAADIADFLDAAEAVTVTVKLNGVVFKTVRGVWRRNTEFLGQGEELRVLPSLLIPESDLTDVTRAHTLGIDGIDYRQLQAPLPDNAGFARIGLVR